MNEREFNIGDKVRFGVYQKIAYGNFLIDSYYNVIYIKHPYTDASQSIQFRIVGLMNSKGKIAEVDAKDLRHFDFLDVL